MDNYILGMRLEATDFQREHIIIDINDESIESDFVNSCMKYNYNYKILRQNSNTLYNNYNLGQNKMLLFRDYLKKNRHEYNKILLSDVFDVVVLKEGLFDYIDDTKLYIGDGDRNLGIRWIKNNSNALLKHSIFENWYNLNLDKSILNTGLIAGNIDLVIDLLDKMCDIITKYCENYDEGNDIFILNYICYNYYNDILIHGSPFNTEFRKKDHDNKECYLAHK